MKKTEHTCNCFGIQIVATNLASAAHTVLEHIACWRGEYITFVNVHTLMMAVEKEEYLNAQELAICNFADGKPIVWMQKKQDYIQASRVAGPDFMDAILRESEGTDMHHFFYGSTKDVLEKMVQNINQKYPGVKIAGSLAPAYVENIDKKTFDRFLKEDIRRINETNPDFVWIGLGAPKQELFMMHAKGHVGGVMLGVGATFDFWAGTQKRAPKWMQFMGLEWLHRMITDPKRLWKRYLKTNAEFIWHFVKNRG